MKNQKRIKPRLGKEYSELMKTRFSEKVKISQRVYAKKDRRQNKNIKEKE